MYTFNNCQHINLHDLHDHDHQNFTFISLLQIFQLNNDTNHVPCRFDTQASLILQTLEETLSQLVLQLRHAPLKKRVEALEKFLLEVVILNKVI